MVHATTIDLLSYIAKSPTPLHCVAESLARLTTAGFSPLAEMEPWQLQTGGAYVVTRGGSLIAFRLGSGVPAEQGFRIVGAHTDSPNLRLKPNASITRSGCAQLAVEPYGGLLSYTWLDRDLGLAGVVMVDEGKPHKRSKKGRGPARGHAMPRALMLHINKPILRIPSLAIHLQRDVNRDGLKLNEQEHLVPLFFVRGDKEKPADHLRQILGKHLDVVPGAILGWDLALTDCAPPTLGGHNDDFIFSSRLDNQAMCHAALTALLRCKEPRRTAFMALYDHEEVGSASATGAAGSFAEDVLRRLCEGDGPGAVGAGLARAIPKSLQVSADMAHALHPNYADKHEPQHRPRLNGGPVIKVNAQQRYATDAHTSAVFESICRDLKIDCQKFVMRSDLPCGSTIGPIAAARLGVRTVDVGNPMLSMHSIREQAGSEDPEPMTAAMAHFLAG